MTPPARIELHIEELVLHGFAPGDRASIGAAVQAELVRLLAEHGAPAGWGRGADAAAERLDGGEFALAPGARADSIGAQVARAVYGSLGGSLGGTAGERAGGATGGQAGGGGR